MTVPAALPRMVAIAAPRILSPSGKIKIGSRMMLTMVPTIMPAMEYLTDPSLRRSWPKV